MLKLCNDVMFPDTLLSETIHDMDKYLSLTDCILEMISNMSHCNHSPKHLEQVCLTNVKLGLRVLRGYREGTNILNQRYSSFLHKAEILVEK